jgi:hypothetical protein
VSRLCPSHWPCLRQRLEWHGSQCRAPHRRRGRLGRHQHVRHLGTEGDRVGALRRWLAGQGNRETESDGRHRDRMENREDREAGQAGETGGEVTMTPGNGRKIEKDFSVGGTTVTVGVYVGAPGNSMWIKLGPSEVASCYEGMISLPFGADCERVFGYRKVLRHTLAVAGKTYRLSARFATAEKRDPVRLFVNGEELHPSPAPPCPACEHCGVPLGQAHRSVACRRNAPQGRICEPGIWGKAGRCPGCGWSFRWDGQFCHHCSAAHSA